MDARPRNVLFICTQNRLRSPTAEQVFADWPGIETASAGLGNDAEVPVSPELLAWADLVFVMEKVHRTRLSAKFGRHLNGKRVICLDIPDDYEFMDTLLIRLLKQKVTRFLPTHASDE
ncbi:low molecular weight protein tyrosine phosphatase family protein [Pseudoxanthomonas sp. SL93]|uniref:low molecular weight protein tyrosine phosphatase family protein n=1 Tax=Pseudoxanthomonas sp. SL93 TaxID=2995142 RepID=UPI0022707F8E|nr:low molecular weight protein tyrosine phosphatase family protein [Pseudoxanthomonas sp. SL93]WAC63776.1 low molecular weight protein tyrosine phosphatase family protein [Pseudoxanthomonas sp. SL93]